MLLIEEIFFLRTSSLTYVSFYVPRKLYKGSGHVLRTAQFVFIRGTY